MKEFDRDNDRMLSFNEFELGINGTGAKNDQGWQVNAEHLCISPSAFFCLLLVN